MLEIYTFLSILLIFIFISINIKLFLSYKFWPFLFFLFYAYTLPMMSNLYLEQGIYITEQERNSYFTGSTLRLIFYTSIFFIACFFSLQIFVKLSIKKKTFSNITNNPPSIRITTMFLFYIAILAEVLLYINLFSSEIPLFSTEITRFNYWENSQFPFLKKFLGNISLYIAIILGIYYMYFTNNFFQKWRKITLYLFLIYFIYLYLIGQKFSAQFIAIYLFLLPYWITNFKKFSSYLFSIRSLKFLLPLFVLMFVFILYKYQFTGISHMKGSALSGIIYRVLGLQGHVYWGIDEMVFQRGMYGWQYYDKFINSGLNGLLLEMQLIGPSNLDWYLNNHIQFTNGYPAILLLLNPFFAIFFQIIFAFLFSLFVFYTYTMLLRNNIYRSFFSIMIVFQLEYALSMGNFQYLYGIKLLLPFFGILIIEISNIFKHERYYE